MVRSRVLAASIAVVLLTAGCVAAGPPRTVVETPVPTQSLTFEGPPGAGPLAAYYEQEIGWRECGKFLCGWLSVPLDYDNPAHPIELALVKQTASRDRIGSVVLNPGGPGGSGVEYARGAAPALPKQVRERFDVVGFDPRGVGASRPSVRCVSASTLDDFLATDPSPDDEAEKARLVDEAKTFAAGCKERSGDLLAHMGTPDVVRDLDVLRAVLGDEQLTYIGKSYGTMIGALYAERFPDRVRALVLDGAIDPTLDARQLNEQQALGFEAALAAFLADCVANDCPLGATTDAASQRLIELFTEIDTSPLPASGAAHGPLTEAHAVLGVAAALYSPDPGWRMLRGALREAVAGDGSTLMRLSDLINDRRDNGSYSNLVESNAAVNCVDRPYPADISAYDTAAAELAQRAPHFGAAVAYSGLVCSYWPARPVDGPRALQVTDAPGILVIGTTGDPATPYRWAQALTKQLRGAVLLTYEGEGHTIYGDGRSACVDEQGTRYLVDLTLPAVGETCS